jgi:hypothetical protein
VVPLGCTALRISEGLAPSAHRLKHEERRISAVRLCRYHYHYHYCAQRQMAGGPSTWAAKEEREVRGSTVIDLHVLAGKEILARESFETCIEAGESAL